VEDPKLARHYWPIKNGVFNEVEYLSRQELMGDIQLIIEDALKTEMGITSNDMSNYSVVLVIPDLFDKTYIYEWTRLLFQDMRFSKVAYFQVNISNYFVNRRNRYLQHLELVSLMHALSISELKLQQSLV
jgi:hypothetical protein